MESTSLASSGDAELLLHLYDLRREATMRAARQWITEQFQPASAAEVIAVIQDSASQSAQYLRQVVSYWEMAASFVLRGALDGELFVDCSSENMLLLAKFHPFLEQIRTVSPDFLVRTEQLTIKTSGARLLLERYLRSFEGRRSSVTV